MPRLTKDQRLTVKNCTLMSLAYAPSQAVFDACKFRTLRMFAKQVLALSASDRK